jgi:tetratricopeptide (TPR) repeat protein
MFTQRFAEAVRHGSRRKLKYFWTGRRDDGWTVGYTAAMLHALGRDKEAEAMADELLAIPGTDRVSWLTTRMVSLAGQGRVAEIERLLSENEGLRKPNDASATSSRATLAAWELRAHGHVDDARRIARSGLSWFERQRSQGRLDDQMLDGYVDLLWQAEEWEQLARAALEMTSRAEAPESYRMSALSLLALAQHKRGNPANARVTLAGLDAFLPDAVPGEVDFNRSKALFAMEDWEHAMDAFRAAYDKGHYAARLHDIRHRMLPDAERYPPFRALVAPR